MPVHPLPTLKKRREFLAVSRQGKKIVMPGFILQFSPCSPEKSGEGDSVSARVGYVATKKLGKANFRNRVKRRLREAVRLSAQGKDGFDAAFDYVFIGRKVSFFRPFEKLCRDMRKALDIQRQGGGECIDSPAR